MAVKQVLNLIPLLLLTGCVSTSPSGVKKIGIGPLKVPIPFTGGGDEAAEVDPFAIWQEWAIYIVIAGIVIGVVDFAADRKLTFIGPAVAICGFIVSVWGVTLKIVDTVLPWFLGAAIVSWVAIRLLKAYRSRQGASPK